MIKFLKNKVGRPSNKILRKRRIFYLMVLLVCVFIIASIAILISSVKLDKLTSTIIGGNSNQKLTLVVKYSTVGLNSHGVQGSTGYQNKIYYATTKGGTSGQKNYYTGVKIYNLNSKKMASDVAFDQILSNYPTYKINDATTNTTVGRNYYVANDASNGGNSKIIFSTNNIVREINTNIKISNIAYNSGNKKYYSIKSKKVYVYEISNPSKSNTSSKLGVINLTKACNIKYDSGITTQGITMIGNRLYFAYQKHPNNPNIYANYISIYDARNCRDDVTLEPVHTLNLGTCSANSDIDNCEIESIFYMNSKFYLAYNNAKFNGISFYTLDLPNKNISANVNVKSVNENKVTLQATVKSEKIKLYDYKFCTNEKGTGCSYKAFRNEKNEKASTNSSTVTYTIDKDNSDWYFIARDVLGNKITVKIPKKEIPKVLNK